MKEKWRSFEEEAFEYIKENYENSSLEFSLTNPGNPKKSDIKITRGGKEIGFVEAKLLPSQAGQFVVREKDETFFFSPANESVSNTYVEAIISHMNENYQRYTNARTAGADITLPSEILDQWVINYYKEKKAHFFIVPGAKGFVLFPTERLSDYLQVSARYREKRSGSRELAHRWKEEAEGLFSAFDGTTGSITFHGKRGFLDTEHLDLSEIRVTGEKFTYFLSRRPEGLEVRMLSNTRNSNVIFTIQCPSQNKLCQDPQDLQAFSEFLLG